VGHQTSAVRGAVQRVIVKADQLPILRFANVELEAEAQFEASSKVGEGVLGGMLKQSAVRHDQGPGGFGSGGWGSRGDREQESEAKSHDGVLGCFFLRHASEQYFTSSHTLAHFFRQANGRLQAGQIFVGRLAFRWLMVFAQDAIPAVAASGSR
jgi:hypothetical protein